MRSKKIDRAYELITPDDQTRDRLLDQILRNGAQKKVRCSHPVRKAILIAACISLLAAGAGGYAAYQKWKLPKPETFEPTDQGYVSIHSTEEYSAEEVEESQTADPLSDESFISKATEVLELVGLTDYNKDVVSVSRQENMYWSREEAEVILGEGDHQANVTFNAKTGALIGIIGWDWTVDSDTQADESPDERARYYYELLPVPQGYEQTHIEKYDEQAWTYDFCRKVSENLYNEYEMVRIGINPKSGGLYQLVVFDVPLLDDHEPGDIPITKEQADEIARSNLSIDLTQYALENAHVGCVFPNWHFSDYPMDGHLRASAVSRLGWVLIYSRESEYDDEIRMYIDYYTGEILGGDVTA